MKNFSLEMPEVNTCEVSQCAYNLDNTCNARAITIGDGEHAQCDTFFNSSPHTKGRHSAGVGACKVVGCSYNTDYECQANDISIGMVNNEAMCLTYSA